MAVYNVVQWLKYLGFALGGACVGVIIMCMMILAGMSDRESEAGEGEEEVKDDE